MQTRAVPSPPVLDERWGVVERVTASSIFRRSPRSRELLLFICERALTDRAGDLREQHIGCGVFGRRRDYNPGEDNIVRVEMRLLRKRLEEHFASEGREEPLLIVVPKGTYVPVFESRETVDAAKPAVQPVAPPHPTGKVRTLLQPAAIVVLSVACIWLLLGRHAVLRSADAANDRGPLWPLLFNGSQQSLVICADSTLVVAEDFLGHAVSLEEYLSRDYQKPRGDEAGNLRWLFGGLQAWNFTDIADTRLVQRISRLNSEYWAKVRVRSARSAQLDDFKSGNVVILGSVRTSPWIHLFDPTLNFQMEYQPSTHTVVVRNRAPQPGEQSEYYRSISGSSGVAYCALALVPNLRSTGSVLIIAGTVGEGTEATGEFITNPAASSGFFEMLMKKNGGRLPYFEALLKLETQDGVAGNPELVAVRTLPGTPGSAAAR